jgi:outer membrane protein OmpA-like peptidoglycan-associated protein
MKRILSTSLILCSALAFVTQTSSAQNLNQTASNLTKGSSYIAFSDFSADKITETSYSVESKASALKENASVRSLYMSSEQYVFDNLGSLKKFFSVADIYFDLDQSAIRPDAIPVLDKLVSLMMEHPEISVATTSYSDTRFSKYNEKLALSRAQAANAYLISKGISADRLLVEKHGRPQIANPCNNDPSCSLAVQQLNRKTEFNIVYNGINLGQIN